MPDNDRSEKVRQEIIQLLSAQLEALANRSGLTDAQLTACYTRQERVRELRDRLTLAMEVKPENAAVPSKVATSLPGEPEAAVAGF